MTLCVEDPQSEVSLIYYPNRDGLEDRVFRIKTERSSTSTPEPRTCHFISNIEIIGKSESSLNVRYNWQTLSHRYKTTDRFFGSTSCTIDMDGNSPLISKKTIILKDDYIHQVIDIYHV
ncbi:aromatic-ring-hydroxylating dioxygenase subunit beta [Acetobacter sp. DsW_063]|uniref:aromatic-ring-hydroxylating dioxygenase subunit beta n=1 Tax=Acetobacter sp. DsW_063 TaxID=1514894 RepID=UPI0027153793|nr:aromatic-ring-hydroxylating dioxygenase subunit beta [Acetobacter sp. DsW_063]